MKNLILIFLVLALIIIGYIFPIVLSFLYCAKGHVILRFIPIVNIVTLDISDYLIKKRNIEYGIKQKNIEINSKNNPNFKIEKYSKYWIIGMKYKNNYIVFNEQTFEHGPICDVEFSYIIKQLEENYECLYIKMKDENYCFFVKNNKLSDQIIDYLNSLVILDNLS